MCMGFAAYAGEKDDVRIRFACSSIILFYQDVYQNKYRDLYQHFYRDFYQEKMRKTGIRTK